MAVNKMKSFICAVCIIIAAACLLSACNSEQIQQGDLYVPEVTVPQQMNHKTVTVEMGECITTVSGAASLIYLHNESLRWEGANARFVSAQVEPKQKVQKGDILMTFDVDDHHIALTSLRLERNRLYQELMDEKASRQAAIDAQKQQILLLTSYDRQIAELNLQKMQASFESYLFRANENLNDVDAQIAEMEQAAADNVLVAPFDGVIDSVKRLTAGDPISGSDVLITMHATDTFAITAEDSGNKLCYNAPVTILVTNNKNMKEFSGRVVSAPNILPGTVSQSTVWIQLDGDVAGEDLLGSLRFNTNVQIIQNILVAPRNAIHHEDGGSYVYVLENGTEQKRYVSVQNNGTDMVWILEGLSEGQIVIVD